MIRQHSAKAIQIVSLCLMYLEREIQSHKVDIVLILTLIQEVKDTLWRVSSHPSIVIWAGNNENEAALGTNWYNTSNNFSRYKSDYVSLYISKCLIKLFFSICLDLLLSPT